MFSFHFIAQDKINWEHCLVLVSTFCVCFKEGSSLIKGKLQNISIYIKKLKINPAFSPACLHAVAINVKLYAVYTSGILIKHALLGQYHSCNLSQFPGEYAAWATVALQRLFQTHYQPLPPHVPVYIDWSPCLYPVKDKETGSWRTIQRILLDRLCWMIWRHASRLARLLPTKVKVESRWGGGGHIMAAVASIWRNSRASKRDVRSSGLYYEVKYFSVKRLAQEHKCTMAIARIWTHILRQPSHQNT